MENAMRLLEAIGQIQDTYILDARNEKRKDASFYKKIALIIAAALSLILLTGCTLYVWNWYAIYFAWERQKPLSDSQINYIGVNTQEYQQHQTYGGYTVELKSAISEMRSAYVTFGLTAPEGVDLSPLCAPGQEERLSFEKLLAMPEESSLPANVSYKAVDDGDGRANTLNVVLRIDPVINEGEKSNFGPGKTCKIQFDGIVRWSYDREYEQKLLSTKYAGQSDYMLTSDESSRVHPQVILAAGEWKFEIELAEADTEMVELLTAPISAKMLVSREGASEYESEDTVEAVTMTSIQLRPMGVTVVFERPEPVEKLISVYVDAAQFNGEGSIFVMMTDGTRINLFQAEGAKDTASLSADSPIVLKEADYLQLSDGTKVVIAN